MNGPIGNWLILIGLAILVMGLLVKTGALAWFGQLPGDIEIKREGFRFYFPLASMVLVSIVVSLLLALIRRFF